MAIEKKPCDLAPNPIATELSSFAFAIGPIAIASLPVAPSLFLFSFSPEFTEKYFILFA